MAAPRPHDRPISIQTTPDDVLETFTMRLPRWSVFELVSRNPLVRGTDRIEALVLTLAIVLSLLAVPLTGAVGTAVYDSRRDVYAQQAHTRHITTATITDDTAAQYISRTGDATMQARWSAFGSEHRGAVTAPNASKSGDHIAIWVDVTGALADKPTPTSRAALDAVTAAVALWAGVAAAAAILLAGTRAVCNRIRAIGWRHGIDTLVRPGGPSGQP
ncbi:Rv1733c family protein [Mycolicibacterium pallens]|uniref:Transmembrane protein n=1 Tax=Mycolicibacterium pallens TaxID=370524 RepID=A0ABX8VB27_9MYCO|nr:hypothetical protein [Mycolicibacterium pallens]QYL14697.1 hypothetical protein K0O64_15970 [Mycolicibacterium pallens]